MLFSSCGVEDKAEDALPRLEVSTARLDLTREGTTTAGDVPTLTIRANQGYSMTVDQPWVTVDKPSGKGFQIVTLTVEPNEGDASREAVITVTNNYIAPEGKGFEGKVNRRDYRLELGGLTSAPVNVRVNGKRAAADYDAQTGCYVIATKVMPTDKPTVIKYSLK